MTKTSEPTGIDAARVALAAARKAAKQRTGPRTGPQPAAQHRGRRRSRARDPIGLGAAVNNLMDDHGWEAPAAGASVVDAWPQIAPELRGKVAATRFDATRGALHLQPVSPAYGSHLRLMGRQLIARINRHMDRNAVQALTIQRPGPLPDTGPDTAAADEPDQHSAEHLRAKTREEGSPGYQHARATLLQYKPPASAPAPTPLPEPALRESEDDFLHTTAPAPQTEDVHTLALRRARAEKTATPPSGVQRAFP